MLVHRSLPSKSVSEFIICAKANPDRIVFGSAGIRSTLHSAGDDKLAANYLAFVQFASIRLWLRVNS